MQGAGKTYTMFGPDEVLTNFDGSDPTLWGLAPRATQQLFEGLRLGASDRPLPSCESQSAKTWVISPNFSLSGAGDSTFVVQCSYLEVYNDRLNDLLGDKTNLPLREKPGVGLSIEGG